MNEDPKISQFASGISERLSRARHGHWEGFVQRGGGILASRVRAPAQPRDMGCGETHHARPPDVSGLSSARIMDTAKRTGTPEWPSAGG